MSKLSVIASEIERQIPSPSPGVKKYIVASRAHASNADDIEVPFIEWKASLEDRERAWEDLTPEEKAMIKAIINAI